VGDVEYVRRPAENQRPFVRNGNRPETVFPRGERLPADHHVPAQGDRGGRVGTGTPHLAPRHDSSPPEERPAAGARPVVHDRYLSRAQGLGHGGVLALRSLRWQDRRRQQQHGQLHRCSATTGFRSTPTPGISTSTTSPATSGPTPAGVPVAITSPGSSVMACEMNATSAAGPNTMSRAYPRWRSLPFTRQRTSSSARRTGSSGTTRGPSGQNVSNPLARVHC